jgi:hypothetical protein
MLTNAMIVDRTHHPSRTPRVMRNVHTTRRCVHLVHVDARSSYQRERERGRRPRVAPRAFFSELSRGYGEESPRLHPQPRRTPGGAPRRTERSMQRAGGWPS